MTTFTRAFRSELREGAQNIKFKKQKIQLQQLCNSDETIPIKFNILVNNKVVSYAVTSIRELRLNNKFQMKNIRDDSFAGEVELAKFQVVNNPNFADYLRSGWQMSLSVAIDFTASNGQVNDGNSLHAGGTNNDYTSAIKQVGDILE